MTNVQRVWRYFIAEPFTWVFHAFFQPRSFEREFETRYPRSLQRFEPLLRLVVPMILVSLPLAIAGSAILLLLHLVSQDIANFFFNIAVGIVLGIAVGIVLGIARGITVGIAGGITVSILLGIAFGILRDIAFDITGGIVFSIAVGIVVGIVIVIARDIAFDITGGIAGGITVGIVLGITVGITVGITGGIAGGIVLGIILGIVLGSAFGIAGGIARGIAVGNARGIVVGIAFGIAFGIAIGIAVGIAWVVGIFRLPLYLASGPSAYKAYRASRNNPSKVFVSLHRCSLYWDECVYLPLPFLKRMLLIAYDESLQKALEEIDFIVAERPQQLRAARAAALEITIRYLEERKSFEHIAEAAQQLSELLPPETKLTNPFWSTPLARLSDASRDAMRAIAPIGLQGRRKALNDMQANLRKVYPDAFRDQRLNARLAQLVAQWQEITRQKQEQLSLAAQDIGNIDNPYKPGQHLSLRDSLFVGRRDLAETLEGALSKDSRRPTFLLNGERRMGKTSALKQLPNLLGSRYVSVFYNLQESGIYASTLAFLGTLANNIRSEMNNRAMPVEPLQFGFLQEARQANAPSVYRYLEDWLAGVENILKREHRILLLAFDEFEILEEAEQARYMDIRLLLNWMRSIIQFHPHIVLLFSGVKTFDEMGKLAEIDWTSYFINVQMLRISFLKTDETRHLITKPTPNFPGETIFPSDVVEMIITETGCHPFMVQAVCSAIITLLNVDKREQATPEDVMQAVERTLEEWKGHLANLWNRTDGEQRVCLEALLVEQRVDSQWLVQHTGLDEKIVRHALQKLLRRDLVLRDQGEYYIAVPMFQQWLQRNA